MITLLPEVKKLTDRNGFTGVFEGLRITAKEMPEEILELAKFRFWDKKLPLDAPEGLRVQIEKGLPETEVDNEKLFREQGYTLDIAEDGVQLCYEGRAGLINGLTSLKQLLEKKGTGYRLPTCQIVDYPSLETRAIAQTFSWYAGYGRFGFDSQLWGYEEWVEYLNICLDNKINQFNLVMYGYWPFALDGYPETVFRDVPIKIWNAENRRWLSVRYTHPNLEEPFMDRFIALAHQFEVKIFAYVGLYSGKIRFHS